VAHAATGGGGVTWTDVQSTRGWVDEQSVWASAISVFDRSDPAKAVTAGPTGKGPLCGPGPGGRAGRAVRPWRGHSDALRWPPIPSIQRAKILGRGLQGQYDSSWRTEAGGVNLDARKNGHRANHGGMGCSVSSIRRAGRRAIATGYRLAHVSVERRTAPLGRSVGDSRDDQSYGGGGAGACSAVCAYCLGNGREEKVCAQHGDGGAHTWPAHGRRPCLPDQDQPGPSAAGRQALHFGRHGIWGSVDRRRHRRSGRARGLSAEDPEKRFLNGRPGARSCRRRPTGRTPLGRYGDRRAQT